MIGFSGDILSGVTLWGRVGLALATGAAAGLWYCAWRLVTTRRV